MIVTAERFKIIVQALFGNTKSYAEAGRLLDLDRSQILRYATGATNVSPNVRAKLAVLCLARGEALVRIAIELDPRCKLQHHVEPITPNLPKAT